MQPDSTQEAGQETNNVSEEQITEDNQQDATKLKYPCTKCDESFVLKVDLKVNTYKFLV